jgi:hypothetical protein
VPPERTERLDDLSRTIGKIEQQVVQLGERADEDRDTAERRHYENQGSMGDIRDKMQASIAELRVGAERRTDETRQALAAMAATVDARAAETAQTLAALDEAIKKGSGGFMSLSGRQRIGFFIVVLAFLTGLGALADILFTSSIGWILSHFKFS